MTYTQAFENGMINLHTELAKYSERAIIFLYQSKIGYGHWLSIFEVPDGLSIFDPYGGAPDSWGRYVESSAKKRLGENAPYLLMAITKAFYPTVYWNEYRLQKQVPAIQTCGRWSIARILNKDLDVKEFAYCMTEVAKELRLTTDEMICLYIYL